MLLHRGITTLQQLSLVAPAWHTNESLMAVVRRPDRHALNHACAALVGRPPTTSTQPPDDRISAISTCVTSGGTHVGLGYVPYGSRHRTLERRACQVLLNGGEHIGCSCHLYSKRSDNHLSLQAVSSPSGLSPLTVCVSAVSADLRVSRRVSQTMRVRSASVAYLYRSEAEPLPCSGK